MDDSPDNAGDAIAPKEGGQSRRLGALPRLLVVIGVILTIFVWLLGRGFWAPDGGWDFEGDRNFHYWLFVSGGRTEKLGLVAPTDKPVKYNFRGSDGNFPGWTAVSYESKAAPAEVIDAYAKRCESLKAKVTRRPAPEQKDDTIAVRLECEFAGYLTVDFFTDRKSSSSVSEVDLRVWGYQ